MPLRQCNILFCFSAALKQTVRPGTTNKSKIPAGKVNVSKTKGKETVASKLKGKGEQTTERKTVPPPGKTMLNIANIQAYFIYSLNVMYYMYNSSQRNSSTRSHQGIRRY